MKISVKVKTHILIANDSNWNKWPFSLFQQQPLISISPHKLQHGPTYVTKAVRPGFRHICQEMPQTGLARVQEDRRCHRGWICHHGVHWILCQAHSHSSQNLSDDKYICWTFLVKYISYWTLSVIALNFHFWQFYFLSHTREYFFSEMFTQNFISLVCA